MDLAAQAQFLLGGVPQIVVRVGGLELLACVDGIAFVIAMVGDGLASLIGQRFQRIVGICVAPEIEGQFAAYY